MDKFDHIPAHIESIASSVVDSAFKVHSTLGPGLLESVYEVCLCHELSLRDLPFQRQVSVPVVYEGIKLDAGLRLDMLVAESVIVDLKSVEKMNPVFEAQLLTYLKLTGKRIGILINFNVPLIRDGIKRIIL